MKWTNYLITVPIFRSRSEEVGEALIEHVISKFCAPGLYNYGSRQRIHVKPDELPGLEN